MRKGTAKQICLGSLLGLMYYFVLLAPSLSTAAGPQSPSNSDPDEPLKSHSQTAMLLTRVIGFVLGVWLRS